MEHYLFKDPLSLTKWADSEEEGCKEEVCGVSFCPLKCSEEHFLIYIYI